MTTKRPAKLTSWVSRAPFAPIGFLRDLDEHRLTVLEQPLDPRVALLDVVGVEGDVAAVQDAVLRVPMSMNAASIPGSTFCNLSQVDVAVDAVSSGSSEPT